MNNLFLIIFCISFLCIPVFIVSALIKLIQKRPAKKRFKFAGISALALIISTVGFGFTMDDVPPDEADINVVSESVAIASESPTLHPTITPTAYPTETPTQNPTKSPTPKPTKTPTPQPTATPKQHPTTPPTVEPTMTPSSQPTAEPTPQLKNTPETEVIAETTSQTVESTESQSAEDPSNSGTGSDSNGSNFNTYNNPEQQQTADTYVLNTSRHKIHYPSCSSVPKIAPKNYATSNSSIAELEAQGYTTCGNCFK